MKRITLLAISLIMFISCKQKADSTNDKSQEKELNVKLFGPSLFIGKHKTKAMVLGVFHFQDAGLDSYKPKFPFNILEVKRQIELDSLLNRVMKYKPTKILLEWNRIKRDSITNAQYQQYLNGSFSMDDKANEVYQIGFKLAKKLGHERVYCSDASADWFGVELDWDNYDDKAYMTSMGQYEKFNRYDYEPFYNWHDSLKTTHTLVEHLELINDPKDRLKDHQSYLTSILEGAGDNYLGADNVIVEI